MIRGRSWESGEFTNMPIRIFNNFLHNYFDLNFSKNFFKSTYSPIQCDQESSWKTGILYFIEIKKNLLFIKNFHLVWFLHHPSTKHTVRRYDTRVYVSMRSTEFSCIFFPDKKNHVKRQKTQTGCLCHRNSDSWKSIVVYVVYGRIIAGNE